MLGKMRKMLKGQEGFTLIELITVLVILAVILAIGIPKYIQIQAQSEWDTDKATITSFAKVAEVYSAQHNHATPVTIKNLIDAGLIDGDMELNRTTTGANNGTKVSASDTQAFAIDDSGNVTQESINLVVSALIGTRPGTTPATTPAT